MTDGATDPGVPERPAAQPRTIPRATTILLALAGATVTTFGIAALAGIVGPVFLALILTICANPVRAWLERKGVPRGLATGSVILVTFGLLVGFIWLLIVALANFATLLPEFAPDIQNLGTKITGFLTSVGFGPQQIQAIASGFEPGKIADLVAGLLGSVTGIITWLVIILTCLILMAMDGGYMPTLLRQIEPRRPQLVTALRGFGVGVRRYMVVTTILGVGQGIFNAIALTILGVPGAVLWGILSFLCSFIPNVGYFIAIIPPIIFGYFTGGWPTVIAIVIIYGVINAIVQSVVQPRVVGNAVQLSQTLTFVSVLFWAVVLGAIGAILAVPLTLLARTILLDADPATRMWRPLTGDVGETRDQMKVEDAQRKADRKARKADEGWVDDSDDTGVPAKAKHRGSAGASADRDADADADPS